MSSCASFPALLESFFTNRLTAQRRASPHTIASYRDSFRLLLRFAQKQIRKAPASLSLEDLDAPLIGAFLDDIENARSNTGRSRNLRLTAIRSFFRYAALECPERSGQIQRILAIPAKRRERPLVDFLTRSEIDALLAAPDRTAWVGRRDHAFLLTAIQTGLRLSEMTMLHQGDVELRTGAHVRCEGKGRKHRSTPLTRTTVAVLKGWIKEQGADAAKILFPTRHGNRMSPDTAQYLVTKYAALAAQRCPELKKKTVTPHVLRHTTAMELLQSGADRSMIALWLGHERLETTQIYLDANLALKEAVLKKTAPVNAKPDRYRPDDELMKFLNNL